jgi:hypothetical protein
MWCHVSAEVWLTADVGYYGCAMWHQLSEVTFCSCAMWHRLGWGGPLIGCHVALWWGPPVRWLVPGWGPLADVDQWEGATWHLAAEVAQSGAATWHRLGEVVTVLGAPLGPQIVPRVCSVPKLYPEKPWSNLSPLICLFNLFYLL